ncbi:MAG: contractile injection system protein, VgrG/Pvc8 family [Candidatus Korobacteraceae bacterium]
MPETPVTQNAAYSAIPTVQVDGQLNDKVTEQLLGMEMRESEGGMSSLELRFSNFGSFGGGLADFVFEDGAVLKLGVELKVYAGDITSPTEIFRGKITGLEERFPGDGPPDLIALAEDSLQAARMKQRSKNWDDTTLGDIVKQVAANLGLTPVVDGLDASVGTQQQFNESDLHFLRRLLARYDADLQIVGTELHASPRAQAQRNTLELDMNSQLRKVRVLADLSHQVSQVTATGWDYQQGQVISATSQTTSFGPGSGKTGKDWLQQALATRSRQLAQFAGLDSADSQALTDAELAQRARRFVVANGVAEGNPNLRVGSYLTLVGLGPRFSNTYYTTATIHRFDTSSGYETEFTAECAYLGGAS